MRERLCVVVGCQLGLNHETPLVVTPALSSCACSKLPTLVHLPSTAQKAKLKITACLLFIVSGSAVSSSNLLLKGLEQNCS